MATTQVSNIIQTYKQCTRAFVHTTLDCETIIHNRHTPLQITNPNTCTYNVNIASFTN